MQQLKPKKIENTTICKISFVANASKILFGTISKNFQTK
jgi:hypothetical protein